MPAPIKDEFTNRPISRQRKYQLRKLRAGLCKQCGKTAMPDSVHCDRCATKNRGCKIVEHRDSSGCVATVEITKPDGSTMVLGAPVDTVSLSGNTHIEGAPLT